MTAETAEGGSSDDVRLGHGRRGFLWALGGLVVLVALVVFVVWAVSNVNRISPGPSDRRPQPLDILRERFARGEITKEQFEEAKRTLGY